MLLTGAFEPVDAARAAGAGCDGVLAKPFEPRQVIGRVKELLGRPVRPIGSLGGRLRRAVRHGRGPELGEPESGAKSIDDYFDQLDAAFSNLAGKPAPVAGVQCSGMAGRDDWFGPQARGAGAAPDDAAASDASGSCGAGLRIPRRRHQSRSRHRPVAPAAEALAITRRNRKNPSPTRMRTAPALAAPVAAAVSADACEHGRSLWTGYPGACSNS